MKNVKFSVNSFKLNLIILIDWIDAFRYFLGQQSGAEDEVISHLNISHVRIEDGGTYRCTADNRVGRAEYSASLHVYGKTNKWPYLT